MAVLNSHEIMGQNQGDSIMTYKNETNCIALGGKSRFLVLAIIILFMGSMAGGKPQQDKKSHSTKTLRTMARVYMAFGEYAKAQPLAEKALITAKIRGESDSELALCLIDLATLYKYQNKLADAEKVCELGLKLQEKTLYENHPYVAYTLRISGSIYLGQGKYRQARSAMDKAMAIMLESHTENDKALAPFWVDIACILVAQGDFKEAESYYNKAMALINSSYGPDHLYTANVLGGVAKLYMLQGRYDEAEELIDRTIATQERIYGRDHHLVAPSWLTKAKVCRAKGDYVRSEKLIEKARASEVRKAGNPAMFAKLEFRSTRKGSR